MPLNSISSTSAFQIASLVSSIQSRALSRVIHCGRVQLLAYGMAMVTQSAYQRRRGNHQFQSPNTRVLYSEAISEQKRSCRSSAAGSKKTEPRKARQRLRGSTKTRVGRILPYSHDPVNGSGSHEQCFVRGGLQIGAMKDTSHQSGDA